MSKPDQFYTKGIDSDGRVFFEDKSANHSFVDFFGSKKDAIAALESLINCPCCINCILCKNCKNCKTEKGLANG